MALTILVTPQTGDTIEAATWVNEFNNIYNNSLSLISPLTGTLNINNNTLTNLALGSASAPSLYFNGDANTGIYSAGADTFNIATGSSLALQVGASWILAAAPEDSRTDSVDVVGIVRSTTSGTPAAGIGVGIAFQAESGDESPSTFGRIDFAATDVGAGTEDTYMDILLRVAGVAEETKYRFASTAGTGFQGTFTHAATADRTWTLPDASITFNAAADISGTTLASNVVTSSITTLGAAVTIATSLTDPLLIGGTADGSTLSLRSTSGVGTTDAIIFQVGNNGGTEAGRINTTGILLWGTTVTTSAGVGDIVLANTRDIRSVNAAGTDTTSLISLSSTNRITFGTSVTVGDNIFVFSERSDPGSAGTNEAYLFARDNGSGKSQLVVNFQSGATQVIATEP